MSLILPNYNQMADVKLVGPSNYLQWLSIFMPILRSNEIVDIIDGIEPCPSKLLTNEEGPAILNPKYIIWVKKDQNLLS
jgi:hypothetical protein